MNINQLDSNRDSLEPQADQCIDPRYLNLRTLPSAEPAQAISPPAGSVQTICQSLLNLRDFDMTNDPSYEKGQENLLNAINEDIAKASTKK